MMALLTNRRSIVNDFDPDSFVTGAAVGIAGIAATVAMSVRSPAAAIDQQRLRDHDILRSQVRRALARAAWNRAEAALACQDASAILRHAARSAALKH
jgi:hypothetical protein